MKPDEFNGLIGSIAGNVIKERAGEIIGGLFGGGSKSGKILVPNTSDCFTFVNTRWW